MGLALLSEYAADGNASARLTAMAFSVTYLTASLGPLIAVAYLLGLVMVLALLRPTRLGHRMVGAGLGLMWVWTGVAYHAMFFAQINKAANAFAAGTVGEEGAVCPVIRVLPGCRGHGDVGNDRSDAHGLADRRDQPIAQAEGAQARGIGGVSLGPGRREDITLRILP